MQARRAECSAGESETQGAVFDVHGDWLGFDPAQCDQSVVPGAASPGRPIGIGRLSPKQRHRPEVSSAAPPNSQP